MFFSQKKIFSDKRIKNQKPERVIDFFSYFFSPLFCRQKLSNIYYSSKLFLKGNYVYYPDLESSFKTIKRTDGVLVPEKLLGGVAFLEGILDCDLKANQPKITRRH